MGPARARACALARADALASQADGSGRGFAFLQGGTVIAVALTAGLIVAILLAWALLRLVDGLGLLPGLCARNARKLRGFYSRRPQQWPGRTRGYAEAIETARAQRIWFWMVMCIVGTGVGLFLAFLTVASNQGRREANRADGIPDWRTLMRAVDQTLAREAEATARRAEVRMRLAQAGRTVSVPELEEPEEYVEGILVSS